MTKYNTTNIEMGQYSKTNKLVKYTRRFTFTSSSSSSSSFNFFLQCASKSIIFFILVLARITFFSLSYLGNSIARITIFSLSPPSISATQLTHNFFPLLFWKFNRHTITFFLSPISATLHDYLSLLFQQPNCHNY